MASGSVLLLCTLSLWILLTTLPALQPYLPYLKLSWETTPLRVPFSQILAGGAGLLCYLCAYCLLYQRSGGNVSLKSNLLFLLFGYMLTYGHGMHSVCVMIEEKGESEVSPSMAAYVDYLHEFVSHNMFMCGLYAMLILIMKAEKDVIGCKLRKKTEKQAGINCHGGKSIQNGSVTQNGFDTYPSKTTTSSETGSYSTTVADFLMQWIMPVIIGAYFSIFSSMTGTVTITMLFYAIIYIYTIVFCQQLDFNGIPIRVLLDLLVWATIIKAACVGLPILGLWLWVKS